MSNIFFFADTSMLKHVKRCRAQYKHTVPDAYKSFIVKDDVSSYDQDEVDLMRTVKWGDVANLA
jgi:hypothetical protein